ncbi:MAG: DUF5722 domain-containing protein [Clostridia bacterium]|nr:DUF5722 domain-containing protein [Clostridia bacterium]
MKLKIPAFAIFFCLALVCFMPRSYAAADLARVNIYNTEEFENMRSFNMNTIAKTSDFNWNFNGSTPKQRTEKGLPGYVILGSSDDDRASYSSVPNNTIDAFEYKSMGFAIRLTKGEYEIINNGADLIMTLVSGEHILECKGRIRSGSWNVITFDVGAWKYRKEITGLTVSLIGDDGKLPLGNIELSGPYAGDDADVGMEKFMSEWLSSPGTEIEHLNPGKKDEALRVALNSKRISISGRAAVPYTSESYTSVRIILTNESPITNMQFSYSYLNTNTGNYSTAVKNIPLESGAKHFSYLVSTCDVSLISSFSLILDSAGVGSVTVHSIEPVLIYDGYSGETFGSINSCKTDKDKRYIDIEGSVYHSFLISHADSTLLCYKLSFGESFADAISSGKKPVAEAKMSSKFTFELKISKLEEPALISKYAIAVKTPEGKLFPLASPVSVEGDFGSADTAGGKTNIKGLEYDYISTVSYCGVGTAIVDVYLDKLTGAKQSGHIYTTNDTFIYFDAEYVSELDKNIRNLYADGAKTYLRLLISASADTSVIPYASKPTGSADAEFLSIDIQDEKAEKNFFATVDFLARRYSEGTNGKISGLIMGRSVDLMEKCNYSVCPDIRSYAMSIAHSLEIMARTAVMSIPGIEIVLPISDMRGNKSGFDTELLLTSVSKYLEDGGGLEFSLMLESNHSPYSNMSGGVRTFAGEDSDYYCTDNLYVFERILQHLSYYSSSAPISYIYHWSPDLEESATAISAEYIYNYYSIMFSDKASAFVLSLPKTDKGNGTARSLSYLMKYIDTDINRTGSLCLSALSVFGAESWEELIPWYDENEIVYRQFNDAVPIDSLPENVKGSFDLWNFSSAFGALDWFEGSGCSSLYVDGAAKGGKALCAEVPANTGKGEYSDIVYRFEYADDISLMPYLEFDIKVEDAGVGAFYEILVIIGGDGDRIESQKLVYGGDESRIYINTSLYENPKEIDFIRIRIRRSGNISETSEGYKLYLRRVTAHSDVYGDEALREKIENARAKARNIAESEEEIKKEIDHDFIIAIIIVIIPAVALVGFYERKQK